MKIVEGLFLNDLMGLILPEVSIFEYDTKIEPSAIVIAFFVKHNEAAEDLSIFIEKSAVEHILDTEVSSAPNENGNYLVFVEMDKDVTVEDIMKLIDLCEHLCDVENWKFTGYKLSKEYSLTRENIKAYLAAIKSGKIS